MWQAQELLDVGVHACKQLFVADNDMLHCNHDFLEAGFVRRVHDNQPIAIHPYHEVFCGLVAEFPLVIAGRSNGFNKLVIVWVFEHESGGPRGNFAE